MKKLILLLVICISPIAFAQNSTLNPILVPQPLIKAMQEVHAQAAQASVRNLFMYKYTYFQGGFCANQDCSATTVQAQINLWKSKMGDSFNELNKNYQSYADEIRFAQSITIHKDIDNLMSYRSALDILTRSIFTTCVDFAKAIAAKALVYGMNLSDLKFFWLMGKEGFEKMCPGLNGQPAIPPRPLMHTIIAYHYKGAWYAMNSENPNPEIIPLGKNLPSRLSLNFIFSSPPLVSGLPLTYAGSYDFLGFLGGFSNQTILNIAASGTESSDPADFICR